MCMTCGPRPPCQRLDRWLQQSRGGAQPWGGCTFLVRRFAFLTAGCGEDEGACYRGAVACSLCDDSPSSRFGPACMTCEAWPPCHRMGTLVRIGGDLARDASGHEWGNLPFKKRFTPRVAAMSYFFPTRGALLSPSSSRPFAFKVSALRCRSLPWPCDSIPSMPRLSECSKWYTACSDGMRRHLPEGFASALSTLMSLPLESSCLLSSLAGRCYRYCLPSTGGVRPCGSSALLKGN
jgi:hypothetical protein